MILNILKINKHNDIYLLTYLYRVLRIIGLCLLQNEICPLYLNRHVLKSLLGRKISWHDLAFFDPVMYESLRQLSLDAESKDASSILINMDLTFSIELSTEEVYT